MAQGTRKRLQESKSIDTFGQKLVFKLGKGHVYRALMLHLVGSLTWAAGASNAAATMGRGDEWSVIERVDVVLDGQEVIRSFSGNMLAMLNEFWFNNQTPFRTSAQMGDGATAAPTFDSTLIIPFWQPKSAKPMDTALDSRKYGNITVEITIGSSASVNTAANMTAVNATMELYSYESFGLDAKFSDWHVYSQEEDIAGATNRRDIQLNTGGMLRGLLINCADAFGANGNDIAVGTSLDMVEIVSGGTVFWQMAPRVARDYEIQRQGFPLQRVQTVAATSPQNALITNSRRNTRHNQDGWLYIDLCEDGYLGEAIDSYSLSELKVRVKVLAAVKLTLIPSFIYPLREVAAKAAA